MIYKNLLIEISMYKDRLDDLIKEEYGINRMINTHKITVRKYYARQVEITNEKIILLSMLEEKEYTLDRIKRKLRKLKGLEYVVDYKRIVEGKTLQGIADELGYEHGYIRKISARIKQRTKEEQTGRQK